MRGIEKRLARYPSSTAGSDSSITTGCYPPKTKHSCWPGTGPKWASADTSDFTTSEAVAAITRITSGNFRPTCRLVTQIQRVLDINHLTVVTREVVEAARESLVI